jgi:hypothetical protein
MRTPHDERVMHGNPPVPLEHRAVADDGLGLELLTLRYVEFIRDLEKAVQEVPK